jgi:hypothetical protein
LVRERGTVIPEAKTAKRAFVERHFLPEEINIRKR